MPETPIESLIELTRTALKNGTFAEEEQRLRKAIGRAPSDINLVLALGVMLREAGRFQEAAFVLTRAAQLSSDGQTLRLLAETQNRAWDYQGYTRTLERLADQEPWNDAILLELAKAKQVTGDRAGARIALGHASELKPRCLVAALGLAVLADDLEQTCRQLRDFIDRVNDEPSLANEALGHIAAINHRRTRQTAGMPPDHATSWSDLCAWSDPGILAEYKTALDQELNADLKRLEALTHRAGVAIAEADWSYAEEIFRSVRKMARPEIAFIANFDAAWWDELHASSGAETYADLPSVTTVSEYKHRGPALFFASDHIYCERFTIPCLRGLARTGSTMDVHVHIMDGGQQEWARLAAEARRTLGRNLLVTAEDSLAIRERTGIAPRNYYHAMRFVRFSQAIQASKQPSWIMDVDAALLADPAGPLSAIAEYDVALLGKPGLLNPWDKIAACLVGVRPTTRGLEYLNLVSAFILRTLRDGTLRWYVDQLALFSAYAYLTNRGEEPRTWFLGPDIAVINEQSSRSVFRFVSGMIKHVTL